MIVVISTTFNKKPTQVKSLTVLTSIAPDFFLCY
jgi:hypothetical protein